MDGVIFSGCGNSCFLGISYMNTQKEAKQLKEEKAQQKAYFEEELDSLMSEHNQVKTAYGIIADSLRVKDSIITENAQEIKQLLHTKWEYYKVQKKMQQLRKVAQGYLVQIDSLYRVNKVLKEENIAIKTKFRQEQLKTKELVLEKERLNVMVENASEIKVYDIKAQGVHSTLFTDEKVTDKARRTDKIKICFSVVENELTEHGNIDLYFRIADPQRRILTPAESDAYTFEMGGDTLQYTLKKTIDYQGETIKKCVYWIRNQNDDHLNPGKYTVDIYTTGGKLSQTYFDLR